MTSSIGSNPSLSPLKESSTPDRESRVKKRKAVQEASQKSLSAQQSVRDKSFERTVQQSRESSSSTREITHPDQRPIEMEHPESSQSGISMVESGVNQEIASAEARIDKESLKLDLSGVQRRGEVVESPTPETTDDSTPIEASSSTRKKSKLSSIAKVPGAVIKGKNSALRHTTAKAHHTGGNEKLNRLNELNRPTLSMGLQTLEGLNLLMPPQEITSTEKPPEKGDDSKSVSVKKRLGQGLSAINDVSSTATSLIDGSGVQTLLNIATKDMNEAALENFVTADTSMTAVVNVTDLVGAIHSGKELVGAVKDHLADKKKLAQKKEQLEQLKQQPGTSQQALKLETEIKALDKKVSKEARDIAFATIQCSLQMTSGISGSTETLTNIFGATAVAEIAGQFAGPLQIVGGLINTGENLSAAHKGQKIKDRARAYQEILADPMVLLESKKAEEFLLPISQKKTELMKAVSQAEKDHLQATLELHEFTGEYGAELKMVEDWTPEILADNKEIAKSNPNPNLLRKIEAYEQFEELNSNFEQTNLNLKGLKSQLKGTEEHLQNINNLIIELNDGMSEADKKELISELNTIARNVKRHQGIKTHTMKAAQGMTSTAGGVLATLAVAGAVQGLGPAGWGITGAVIITALAMEINHESEQVARDDLNKGIKSSIKESKQSLAALELLKATGEAGVIDVAQERLEPLVSELSDKRRELSSVNNAIENLTEDFKKLPDGPSPLRKQYNDQINVLAKERDQLLEGGIEGRISELESEIGSINESLTLLKDLAKSPEALDHAIEQQKARIGEFEDLLYSKSADAAMKQLVNLFHEQAPDGTPSTKSTLAMMMLTSVMHQNTDKSLSHEKLLAKAGIQ